MLMTYIEKFTRKACRPPNPNSSNHNGNNNGNGGINLEYRSFHFMGSFIISLSILFAFIPVISAWSSGMDNFGYILFYFIFFFLSFGLTLFEYI